MVAVSHLIGIEQLPTDVSDRVRLCLIITLTNQERRDITVVERLVLTCSVSYQKSSQPRTLDFQSHCCGPN